MSDILYFTREKRATMLITGGFVILFVWLIGMINAKLFEIHPMGEVGISMSWAVTIGVILAAVLLFAVYWVGSGESPVGDSGFAFEAGRFVYVAFKNYMLVLAVIVIIIGLPRIQYYQMRATETRGLDELSYYEQRTLVNLFRDGLRIADASADHSENIDGVVPVPVTGTSSTPESHSSSGSSKKSNGDIWKAILELLCFLAAVLVIFLLIAFYFSLVVLALIYPNFWLVAIVCIAVGMICLGIIDIMDGPEI